MKWKFPIILLILYRLFRQNIRVNYGSSKFNKFSESILFNNYIYSYTNTYILLSVLYLVSGYDLRLGACGLGFTLKQSFINLRACALLCSRNLTCLAFEYSHESLTCGLLTDSCRYETLSDVFWSYVYIKPGKQFNNSFLSQYTVWHIPIEITINGIWKILLI